MRPNLTVCTQNRRKVVVTDEDPVRSRLTPQEWDSVRDVKISRTDSGSSGEWLSARNYRPKKSAGTSSRLTPTSNRSIKRSPTSARSMKFSPASQNAGLPTLKENVMYSAGFSPSDRSMESFRPKQEFDAMKKSISRSTSAQSIGSSRIKSELVSPSPTPERVPPLSLFNRTPKSSPDAVFSFCRKRRVIDELPVPISQNNSVNGSRTPSLSLTWSDAGSPTTLHSTPKSQKIPRLSKSKSLTTSAMAGDHVFATPSPIRRASVTLKRREPFLDVKNESGSWQTLASRRSPVVSTFNSQSVKQEPIRSLRCAALSRESSNCAPNSQTERRKTIYSIQSSPSNHSGKESSQIEEAGKENIDLDDTLVLHSTDRVVIEDTEGLPADSYNFNRVTPLNPISPPRLALFTKKHLTGDAGLLSSHFAALRSRRLISLRDPDLRTTEVEAVETASAWGMCISRLACGTSVFHRERRASRRLLMGTANVGSSPVRPAPNSTPLRLALPLVLLQTSTLRCHCSTEKGAVKCYNGWCEVHNYEGKVGACAVVQKGPMRHFACVRVHETSDDSCKVDRRNGQLQVRCWCRSSDYCNIDLAERVEDGDVEDPYVVQAEEEPTTTMLTAEKDPFVIEQNYDVIEHNYDVSNYEDDDDALDWEDSEEMLPMRPAPPVQERPPPLPPANRPPYRPHTPSANISTVPPWRREYPIPNSGYRNADSRMPLPPPGAPVPPVRPVPTTTRRPTTTTTRPTTRTTSTSTSTTTSTTTTTTTTAPSTTSKAIPPVTSSTAMSSRGQGLRVRPPTDAPSSQKRQEAARSYRMRQQKYRPMDLFAKPPTEKQPTEKPSTEKTPEEKDDGGSLLDSIVYPPSEESAEVPTEVVPSESEPPSTPAPPTTTTRETTTRPPITSAAAVPTRTTTAVVERAPSRQLVPQAKLDFYEQIAKTSALAWSFTGFYVTLFVLQI